MATVRCRKTTRSKLDGRCGTIRIRVFTALTAVGHTHTVVSAVNRPSKLNNLPLLNHTHGHYFSELKIPLTLSVAVVEIGDALRMRVCVCARVCVRHCVSAILSTNNICIGPRPPCTLCTVISSMTSPVYLNIKTIFYC
jgi:hypothetical protein